MSALLKTFLRLNDVKEATGLSRSFLYEAIAKGEFPPPISLGARAVAWDADAIASWQEQRILASAQKNRGEE